MYRKRFLRLLKGKEQYRLIYYTIKERNFRNEIPLTRKTKARRTGQDKFEIELGNGEVLFFKEPESHSAKEWVEQINEIVRKSMI